MREVGREVGFGLWRGGGANALSRVSLSTPQSSLPITPVTEIFTNLNSVYEYRPFMRICAISSSTSLTTSNSGPFVR